VAFATAKALHYTKSETALAGAKVPPGGTLQGIGGGPAKDPLKTYHVKVEGERSRIDVG